MHHKKKEKFTTLKEQGVTREELQKLMEEDGISATDGEKLLSELYPGDGGPQTAPPEQTLDSSPEPKKVVGAPVSPEAADHEKKFDFKNFTGETFKAYNEHLESGLPWTQQFDFEVYRVEPIITELYPGLPNSPKVLTGLRVIDKPIQKTRITPRVASEMNAQVRNTNRYYLLKQ